ncbi:MAG: bifunctional 4-hydroxy-3-methylbut-2-enyl diphosphate reductase/30S ribosomal protein S1 [Clostridiales bacterium]|jgi:4-hydroxy-3-methylbut-2-enyl diphosphate reductase|nr:bifunctional 4-hydroxy-3-methylbut-2-enyl diphosphate reductase/30S ribosomal protein S1 [Clostridiales bacterium]
MITIHPARTAGYCAGVARAVNAVRGEMGKYPMATYGPLIHNKTVTDELAANGVRIMDDLDDWRGETVVIRSHGISPSREAEMKRRGIPYIDCTCPDVKKIHRIAQSLPEGHVLIVLGEASHPEVTAYLSEGAVVAPGLEELLAKLKPERQYSLVAQTTFERGKFEKIASRLSEIRPDITVHDTICDATGKRQAEAEELARRMDVMLVLGDRNSSNTRKLFEICAKHCERTYLLASVHEFRLQFLKADDKIGITAGASTPPAITKEAIQFMNDIANTELQTAAAAAEEMQAAPAPEIKPAPAAESFEDMLNESLVSLHTGDIVKATVISVTSSEVTVDLGYKSDGLITKAEMTEDPNAEITQLVKPGDTFDVQVLRVNDSDGNVLVSKKRLDNQVHFKVIEQAFTDKTPLPGKVTEVVKGGLIALIENCRVFVPSSQISNRFVEDLSVFKGREFNFNILEFDRSKRRIVAGRKELAAIEHQQRRDELFGSLEAGQRLEGVVSRIVEFGAFIDLGGVDGLVHISELSWKRVRKVTDVLQAGDKVTVTVIEVNPEKNKISLSLKDNESNPWNNVAEKYPVGSIVEGKVVRMTTFGAFVTLEDGVDGLVHISQIANRHIAKPEEELSVGQIIQVKVTDINEESHKISLSKREADFGGDAEEDEAVDSGEELVEEDAVEEDAVEEESVVEEVAETADEEVSADDGTEE